MRPLLLFSLPFIGLVLPPTATAAQQPTKSPHGQSELACQNCHTNTAWKPIRGVPDFDHNTQTRFPLRGLHQSVACASCHISLEFKEIGINCSSCHADIHRRQFGRNCEDCHTVRGWDVSLEAVRQHANRFPLVGAHAAVACESCHHGAGAGTFTGLSTACVSCHLRDYQSAKTVDHRAANFSTTCEACHSMASWQGGRFNHNATRFPLAGAHAVLQCASCHAGGKFAGLSTDCFSCHRADFINTSNPNHQASGFPTNCDSCHNETSWQGAAFDHNLSRFPLTGAHVSVLCQQCHLGGRFTGTPQDCVSCHAVQYQATTAPNHAAAGFSQQCALCHTTSAWKGTQFDHSVTGFPLTGAHTTLVCAACHVSNRFAGTGTTCVSCHLKDYQAVTTPNHVAAGFPQTCTMCHTTTQWQGAQFDHARTPFPLTGAHTSVTCASCHVNNQFAGTSSTCVSCHLKDYQSAKAPSHQSAAFSQDCASCHITAQWQGARFDHTKTRFPLTGAHTSVACAMCHTGNRFAGTPQDCISCHAADFAATRNPNHVAAGFPQTCTMCHTTTQWLGGKFDHNTATRFTLTGAHVSLSCAQCHANNIFAGTPQDCATCHANDYNRTTNPNHTVAGFPRDCSLCHSTKGWPGAAFDHSRTRFPLTGAHTTVQCAICHAGGRFAGLGTACAGCHLAAFTATTNPNHVAAGFPQDCTLCHTTIQFKGATFDHSRFFPLTGTHTTVQCASCHVGGRFAGTPTDCYSCHSSEYNGVSNPNHIAAGFPKTCGSCHTTTTFAGAQFAAHPFPIYSGAHAGKWNTCADCHTNSSNYSVFTCLSCHEHNQMSMDSFHLGIKNYAYASVSCYGCHPQGKR